MFFRIPDEFLIDVKEAEDLEFEPVQNRCALESEESIEDIFEEADEEYISESIKE